MSATQDRTFAEVEPQFAQWRATQRPVALPMPVLSSLAGTVLCVERLIGMGIQPGDPLFTLLSSLARTAYAEGLGRRA